MTTESPCGNVALKKFLLVWITPITGWQVGLVTSLQLLENWCTGKVRQKVYLVASCQNALSSALDKQNIAGF